MTRVFFILVAVFITSLSFTSRAYSQAVTFEYYIGRPSLFSVKKLGEAAANIVRLKSEMQMTKSMYSVRIEKARNEYFLALKAGRNIHDKGDTLAKLLYEKDIYNFLNNRILRESDLVQIIDNSTGEIDNGIDNMCAMAFRYWSDNVFEKMYGNASNVIAGTSKMLEAIEMAKDSYDSYRYIRDWREFEKRNTYPPGIDINKGYLISLLHGFANTTYKDEEDLKMNGKPILKGEGAINRYYKEIIALYGEKQVLAVVEKYRKAPKNTPYFQIGSRTYNVSFPYYNIFQLLCDLDGEGIIKSAYLAQCNYDLRCVEERRKFIESCYGAEVVKKTADTIMRAAIQETEKDLRIPGQMRDLRYYVPNSEKLGIAFGFGMNNVLENQLAKNNIEGYFLSMLSEHYVTKDLAIVKKIRDELFTTYSKQKVLTALSLIRDHSISPKYLDPIRLQQLDKTRKELTRLDTVTGNFYSRSGYLGSTNSSLYHVFVKLLNPLMVTPGTSPSQYKLIQGGAVQGDIYLDLRKEKTGCGSEMFLFIIIDRSKGYFGGKKYFHELISSTQELLIKGACREVSIQKINYHFYLDGDLVRKSWSAKEDNFTLLHTDLDIKEDWSKDNSERKETLITGYYR